MKGIIYAIILASLCLTSCASPRVAPRFSQPSTRPIGQSVSEARQHVSAAKDKAKAISQAEKDPTLKMQVEALQIDLDSALTALDKTEAARLALDSQLQAETVKANKLAGDYDKSQAKIQQQAKTIDLVNSYWGLGAFAYGLKVLVKHLLILAAVVAVLVAILFGLSLVFPWVGEGLSFVLELLRSAIKRNTS